MVIYFCENCQLEIVRVGGGAVLASGHPRLYFGAQEYHFCNSQCLYEWLDIKTLFTPKALAH